MISKKFHINWPLAPVADIHDNSENSVIGTRSFGKDSKLVSMILLHYLNGLHDAGCMSTLKHFPGHGGTFRDSHKELPTIKKNINQLEMKEILPFSSLVQVASSIMPGHIQLPLITPEMVTFSSFWLKKYLRNKLNFKGLIITDDLGMRAATPTLNQKNAINSAQKAIDSGANILLLASGIDRFAYSIFKALLLKMQDTTFEKKIRDSVEKIIFYKLKKGLYIDNLKERVSRLISKKRNPLKIKMLQIIKYNRKKRDQEDLLKKMATDPITINKTLSEDAIRYIMGKPRKIFLHKTILVTNGQKKKFDLSFRREV